MKNSGEFKIGKRIEVKFSNYAWKSICQLVKSIPTEVHWYNCVYKEEDAKKTRITYVIDDILILPQQVTGVTVESDGKTFLNLYQEIKDRYANIEDAEERKKTINETLKLISCWGHSHVNMTSSPSGTDNKTFDELIVEGPTQAPKIMLIVNKREEVYLEVFDPEIGITFLNPPASVEEEPWSNTYVEDAIKNKIKVQQPVSITRGQIIGTAGGLNHSWGGNVTGLDVLGRSSQFPHEAPGKDFKKTEFYTKYFAKGLGLISSIETFPTVKKWVDINAKSSSFPEQAQFENFLKELFEKKLGAKAYVLTMRILKDCVTPLVDLDEPYDFQELRKELFGDNSYFTSLVGFVSDNPDDLITANAFADWNVNG